jgi:hypothetical protein
MSLFMAAKGPFWLVKRVRAPVRAGNFTLKEFLFKQGIICLKFKEAG